MPFDTKKAVDSWKKAKPLTLTKTGVSELLRDLPVSPKSSELVKFEQAQKTLEAKLSDAKIKKEKKAVECITQIRDNIKRYLAGIKTERAALVGALKRMHASAGKYIDNVEKAADLGSAVRAELFSRPDAVHVSESQYHEAAVAAGIDYVHPGETLMSLSLQFRSLVEKAKKENQPDAKILQGMKVKSIPDFRNGLQKLEQASKALEALK